VTSDNFPARHAGGPGLRDIVLVDFGREITSAEALARAAHLGLGQPVYEDALYFGIQHPEVQTDRPMAFLHDPWVGFFGRRDVLCLWTNAGRRELGLEGFDERWSVAYRFAFVRAPIP
jgi:hypothetical protein